MEALVDTIHRTRTNVLLPASALGTGLIVALAACLEPDYELKIKKFPEQAQIPIRMLAFFRKDVPEEFDEYIASLEESFRSGNGDVSKEAAVRLKLALLTVESLTCQRVAMYVRKWTLVILAAFKVFKKSS
jgi:hypothetical protein